MALYYISLALTAFFYTVAGIMALLAVVTAVGCLVSETGRRMTGRTTRTNGLKCNLMKDNEDKL